MSRVHRTPPGRPSSSVNLTTIGSCPVASATTASNGSRKERSTTAGRRRRRRSPGTCRRIYGMRGSGCVRPRLVWRPANVRVPPLHHVLAEVLLLLRAPEAELPGAVRVPRPRAEGSAGAARRSRLEIQGRSHHSRQASRRGRGAYHGLAPGSVRAERDAGFKARHHASEAEASASIEGEEGK